MLESALYVVGTPIGHLSDISFRAVETLKSVHFILAEDTRVTKKLLDRYEIKTQMVSYRDQNHDRIVEKIMEKLDMGLALALVSDAGTPTISDPGYKLVMTLKDKGYKIVPIPGPSALIVALAASGLPTDRFIFLGFLPKSSSKRKEALQSADSTNSTIIIYESPARIERLLSEIYETLGDRKISLAHNLTKLSEKIETGKLSVLMNLPEYKGDLGGEFVVLISKEQ